MTATPLRVLLVEDNPTDARLLSDWLRTWSGPVGVSLAHVDRLEDALARLTVERFHAVLLDLTLPDSRGYETFARARARAPEAPIVVLAGTHDEELALRAVREGAQDYVVKSRADGASLAHVIRCAVERRRADETLRHSEERYRAMIEHSSDAILALDRTGVVLFASQSLAGVLGYRPEELAGQSAFDLVHPDDLPLARERLADALARPGAEVRAELRGRHADGSWRIVEGVAVNRLDEAAIAAIVANVRDVTERRRAEAALRESEASYRQLVENAPYGIARTTLEGRLLAVNPALVRMLGRETVPEALELELARDVFADPADARRVLEHVSDQDAHAAEVAWKRKDGRSITVRVTARLLRDATKAAAGVEILAEDVTEQRQLEQQLQQVQKMDAIGRLAGGVAHDFNNILTAILSYADLMLQDIEADSPLRGDLVEVRKAAQRATALTQQLLAFGRKQTLALQVLAPNALVRDVEKMLRRILGEDVTLVTALGGEVWQVRADPGQLSQVLLNLAVNARDAMPQGGTLTIETRNARLDEAYASGRPDARPGDHVMLVVRDTGCGMDETVKAHLFEPFFTTKEKGRGTGLGLATVYGIVKQSGGHVSITSDVGQGTTVHVYLPKAEAEPALASL